MQFSIPFFFFKKNPFCFFVLETTGQIWLGYIDGKSRRWYVCMYKLYECLFVFWTYPAENTLIKI
jgi:hypothetical protein